MATTPNPLILAHRGASASAHENTLPAFSMAVAQDADGIETDIRLTADGAMVLHHDAAAAGLGTIVEHTLDELRRTSPHIPTPDEMLAVCGDLLLDIEIKNDPSEPDHDPTHHAAELVTAWVQTHDLYSRVIVSSFNWDTTLRVRELDGAMPTGQLLGRFGSLADYVPEIADRDHLWVLPSDELLGETPEAGIAAAHEAGLRVMVWTVDDPLRIAALAAAGIDGIITNDPALANRTLDNS